MKIKKIFTQGWVLIKFIYYKMYCFIRKSEKLKYANCWLISERGTDAQDNGYFFFKYVRENHPDIDIRYIITKDSPDFNKIKSLGKYILYGSKDHYISYISSPIIISTHLSGCSPDVGLFFRLQRYGMLKLNGKLIFLQHGVTKDYLPFINPKDTNLSLIITAVKPEYNYFIKKNGFDKDVVKYTGFARFDNLKKVESNIILFMPTFRKYLLNINDNDFIKTEYYHKVNGVINNLKIIKILEQNNLMLVLCLHSQFQKYTHLFNTSSSRIKIVSNENYNVQDLLINSSVLITDYSSVFFDFAYMEKPVVYYQFDYNKYRQEHYSEGYFSYQNDGFGPVVNNLDELADSLKMIIENKFKLDNLMLSKIDSFFPIRDKNNCKRIYNEIAAIYKNINRGNK